MKETEIWSSIENKTILDHFFWVNLTVSHAENIVAFNIFAQQEFSKFSLERAWK